MHRLLFTFPPVQVGRQYCNSPIAMDSTHEMRPTREAHLNFGMEGFIGNQPLRYGWPPVWLSLNSSFLEMAFKRHSKHTLSSASLPTSAAGPEATFVLSQMSALLDCTCNCRRWSKTLACLWKGIHPPKNMSPPSKENWMTCMEPAAHCGLDPSDMGFRSHDTFSIFSLMEHFYFVSYYFARLQNTF